MNYDNHERAFGKKIRHLYFGLQLCLGMGKVGIQMNWDRHGIPAFT